MALQLNPLASCTLATGINDFNQQCLRVLRCTAQALANSPGGLRLNAGTQPWLEGLMTVTWPMIDD